MTKTNASEPGTFAGVWILLLPQCRNCNYNGKSSL